jgi:hypothetical protein
LLLRIEAGIGALVAGLEDEAPLEVEAISPHRLAVRRGDELGFRSKETGTLRGPGVRVGFRDSNQNPRRLKFGAIFGAKSSAKGVSDPWGAITSRGSMR